MLKIARSLRVGSAVVALAALCGLAACFGSSSDGTQAGAGGIGGSAGVSGGASGSGATGGTGTGGDGIIGTAGNEAGMGGASGTSGGGAGGTMDTGGTGGSGATGACTDSDNGDQPGEKGTTTGASETLSDACNADGNLVEYSCEIGGGCTPGPGGMGSCGAPTGKVISTAYDCDGKCMTGQCYAHCPAQGDEVTFVSVAGNGDVVLHSAGDTRTFACTLSFDAMGDMVDCKTAFSAGAKTPIVSIGRNGSFCTGTMIGKLGVGTALGSGFNQQCAFDCVVQ